MALIKGYITLIGPSKRRLQVQVLLGQLYSFEAYRFVLSKYCSTIRSGFSLFKAFMDDTLPRL